MFWSGIAVAVSRSAPHTPPRFGGLIPPRDASYMLCQLTFDLDLDLKYP